MDALTTVQISLQRVSAPRLFVDRVISVLKRHEAMHWQQLSSDLPDDLFHKALRESWTAEELARVIVIGRMPLRRRASKWF